MYYLNQGEDAESLPELRPGAVEEANSYIISMPTMCSNTSSINQVTD